MSCDSKQQAFQAKFGEVQRQLQAELQAIADDTEARAKQIADDFEADHDLAEGVGAAAGTAVGGLVGGTGGGIVGGMIGKTIGSLFTLEIGMRRETVALDVPQATMQTQDMSFDLPTVVVKDSDISFDVPTVRMVTVRGPDVPVIETWMDTQCVDLPWPVGKVCTDVPQTRTVMKPTYYDKPEVVMQTQRIVVGMPTIQMRRQDFKIDMPRIEMKRAEYSVDVPFITLRFIKDAGKRTAALAAALAQQAQDASLQKQIAFKERLKGEVAPLAVAMFACFRDSLVAARADVVGQFLSQISALTGTLTALRAKGVPETDNDYVAVKKQLDDLTARLAAAVRPIDEVLAKLEQTSKTALEQFLGTPKPKSLGGLLRNTPADAPRDYYAVKGMVAPAVSGLIAFAQR